MLNRIPPDFEDMKYSNFFSYQTGAAPTSTTADCRAQSVYDGSVPADAAAATSCFANSFCMSPDCTDIPINLLNDNIATVDNMNNHRISRNLNSASQGSDDCNNRRAITIRSIPTGCSTSAPFSRLASTCKNDELVVASSNDVSSPSNTSSRNGYWSDEAIDDDKSMVVEEWHNDRLCHQKTESSESSTLTSSAESTSAPVQEPSEFSAMHEVQIITPNEMEDDETRAPVDHPQPELTAVEPRVGNLCPSSFNPVVLRRLEPVVARATLVEGGAAAVRSRLNGAQAFLQLLEITAPQHDNTHCQRRHNRAAALIDLIQSLQADDALLQKIQYSPKFVDDVFEYRFTMLPLNHRFVTESEDDVRLLSEPEWRALGIRQTRGWQHFGYSRHERNVLLFRRPLGTCPLTGSVSKQLQTEVNNRLCYINQMQNELFANTSAAEATVEADDLPMYGSSSSVRWNPGNKNSRIALKRSIIAVTKSMDKHNVTSTTGSPYFDLNSEEYTNLIEDEQVNSYAHRSKRHQSKMENKFTDNIDKLFLSIHMPLMTPRF